MVKRFGSTLLLIAVLMASVSCGGTRQSWMPNFSSTNSSTGNSSSVANEEEFYSGYAKEFHPTRQLLQQGQWEQVSTAYRDQEKKLKKNTKNDKEYLQNVGTLGLMEQGMIYLLSGDLDRSISRISKAEQLLEIEGSDSEAVDVTVSTLGKTVTGDREQEAYRPAGFEKVLMLNYESISYLLKGNRKAYNVARRSIDLQKREHEKFEEEIKESKKKMEEKKEEQQNKGEPAPFGKVGETIRALLGKHEDVATEVPNAFVNPFGNYVTGMIHEYDAYKETMVQKSLLDNAKIAYEKGLELNPDSKLFKNAVKELEEGNRPPENTRLLHVVAGRGFAPVKMTIKTSIYIDNTEVPFQLAKYTPIPTPIKRITVETKKGKELAELSTISNIDSLVLRYQQDQTPQRIFDVTTSLIRNYAEQKGAQELGMVGDQLTEVRSSMKNPDTRSWSTLPKDLLAARFHLKKDIDTLNLVARDKNDQVIASSTVEVNDEHHDFIYTRAIQGQMKTMNSGQLWMNYYKE